MNEIKNLHYLPRTSEPREVLFEDRTRAHADHVGQSFDWQSTAAVGVLKAVQFGEWWVVSVVWGMMSVYEVFGIHSSLLSAAMQ